MEVKETFLGAGPVLDREEKGGGWKRGRSRICGGLVQKSLDKPAEIEEYHSTISPRK